MKIAIISEDKLFLRQANVILAKSAHEVLTLPGNPSDPRSVVSALKPDLLLIDGRNKGDFDFAQIEQTTLKHPGLSVVLVSEASSSAFLLDAMRAGVREVLAAIHPAEGLLAAVERAAAKVAAGQAVNNGKIHAFIGTSGGSGTTFLATNFGYQLSQSHKVLLIDLNLQFGDALGFVQDGKASKTIGDIARDIQRLDAPLLNASAIAITPNYSILAAPEEPGQAADITPDHVEAILKLAVTQYDIVLLDMPRVVDTMLMKALDQAASIFLVLQASVPHLRNADKLLSVFRSLDYAKDKIELILNRYDKRSDITLDKIHRTLGPLAIHVIANGYRQVSSAINQGVPLVQLERKHGVIRNLTELGGTVSPHPEQPLGLYARLFKRA